jgi:hypothetical protein
LMSADNTKRPPQRTQRNTEKDHRVMYFAIPLCFLLCQTPSPLWVPSPC